MTKFIVGMFLAAVITNCLAANIFEISCPMGCMNSLCYIGVGCTNCQPGWCKSFAHNAGSFCLMDCGRDMHCANGFCTKNPDSTFG